MSTTRQVLLSGCIRGPIWQGLVCEKYVEELVRENDPRKPRQPLRQRLQRLLKDGDFQHAHLVPDFELVFIRRTVKGRTTAQRTRRYIITDFPSLADLVYRC